MKKKLIVVCGPTSTGKSDFAVELALKINGEIISADSRQVYRGLDIGSGKITKTEMRGVPHHLLDVIDPTEIFSVADYQNLATKAIDDILKRNKVPIICGGSGFYIDSLVYQSSFPAFQSDINLRKKLENMTLEELNVQLRSLDIKRYNEIDKKNKIRLVRAVEIAMEFGSVPCLSRTIKYEVEWHYLDLPDDILKEKIHNRLQKRLKEGMIQEVEKIHSQGVSWDRLEALGLEYRYVALYLQNKLTEEEMIDKLQRAIWQYVRRQRTWFKKFAK